MAEELEEQLGLSDDATALAGDLSFMILKAVQEVIEGRGDVAADDFLALQEKVQKLFVRKADMTALKSETVDLLLELIQTRFRRGFKAVVRRDGDDPANLLSFLMGMVFTTSAIGELATVLDRVLIEQSHPQDFTFAGKGDFIAVEEVMQLLAQGHHTGVLVVEKPDNYVKMYFKEGHVAFVDPNRITRRVIRGEGLREYREIPADLAQEAEDAIQETGTPLFLTFLNKGFFLEEDFAPFLLDQGNEIVYEFIRESAHCHYQWRKVEELPDYVVKFDMGLAVMPILLEAHKQMDDWRMVRRIVPNDDVAIEPAEDRFAMMAELALDASQIKLLAMINGESTVRQMAEDAGIPPFEVAGMIAEFAKAGIVIPPGGPDSLVDQPASTQESMEWGLAALDANEDIDALQDSVLQVFDNMEPGEEEEGTAGEDLPCEEGEDPEFSLKFMRAARKGKKWRSRSNRR